MHNPTYKTHYSVLGSGDPVVLIHGVGLNHSMWRAQRSVLAKHYQVITYDMLGHGGSDNPPQGATLAHYAAQLEQLLRTLNIHQPVTLVGFSMGALVAREFVLQHPNRVSRLVLLSGVFQRTEAQRKAVLARAQEALRNGPSTNIDAAIERWFMPEYLEANRDKIQEIKTIFANNDPIGYATSYHLFALHDSAKKEQLYKICVPTLIATGQYDYGSTPDMSRQLAQYIPHSEVMIINNKRHMLPMEAADRLNDIILSFIGSVREPQSMSTP